MCVSTYRTHCWNPRFQRLNWCQVVVAAADDDDDDDDDGDDVDQTTYQLKIHSDPQPRLAPDSRQKADAAANLNDNQTHRQSTSCKNSRWPNYCHCNYNISLTLTVVEIVTLCRYVWFNK